MAPVQKDDKASIVKACSPKSANDGRLASAGQKRTRTGCLNCRKKRRKCPSHGDEQKPTCEGCQSRREKCRWGIKVSFRPENAQAMDAEHPSMKRNLLQRPQGFQIVDVTQEVIRDYFEESTNGDFSELKSRLDGPAPMHIPRSSTSTVSTARPPEPLVQTDIAAAEVGLPTPSATSPTFQAGTELFLSPQVSLSDSTFEDGIFLPGSQYQVLSAALRSRIIDTARSTVPSRDATPEASEQGVLDASEISALSPPDDDEESRRLAHLSPQQEYILWQNYIGEVASWLDKFDNERHFEMILPMLAKTHSHLKYSLLALSARQMERKEQRTDNACSLALYQHAIHLLSPALQKRNSAVFASCVVLAVLEMLSCSPKAWRRHLDGCAALIQSLGISGTCGSSLERSLFWVFARMDICGGLISSEKTLIPVSKWMGGLDFESDVALLNLSESAGRFDMYANHVVYLCGQVVDLLCSSGNWEQRNFRRSNVLDVLDYTNDWTQLFEAVEAWYLARPDEMKPILSILARSDGSGSDAPFPTILFGNGPAVSGNQMYHTAAVLMLKHKPAHARWTRKPRSILWHARQICAISISNTHHGCWTNSIQPLWIAGQQMSHPSEHRAILEIYKRIENETGWSTKWRQDDLKEYWGNLDE